MHIDAQRSSVGLVMPQEIDREGIVQLLSILNVTGINHSAGRSQWGALVDVEDACAVERIHDHRPKSWKRLRRTLLHVSVALVRDCMIEGVRPERNILINCRHRGIVQEFSGL